MKDPETPQLAEAIARSGKRPQIIVHALNPERTKWRFLMVSRAGESLIGDYDATPEQASAQLDKLREIEAKLDLEIRQRCRASAPRSRRRPRIRSRRPRHSRPSPPTH